MQPTQGAGGSAPKDPYSEVKVPPIEKESFRKQKQPHSDNSPSFQKKSFFQGAFFLFLQKIFEKIFPTKTEPLEVNVDTLILEKMDICLQQLGEENKSQDLEFLSHFSHIWHQFLENSTSFPKKSPVYQKIEALLEEIQHFPPTEEHSLGYYLAEYAGNTWIPVPFIQILEQLHQNYLNSPQKSYITRWRLLIRLIIQEIH